MVGHYRKVLEERRNGTRRNQNYSYQSLNKLPVQIRDERCWLLMPLGSRAKDATKPNAFKQTNRATAAAELAQNSPWPHHLYPASFEKSRATWGPCRAGRPITAKMQTSTYSFDSLLVRRIRPKLMLLVFPHVSILLACVLFSVTMSRINTCSRHARFRDTPSG